MSAPSGDESPADVAHRVVASNTYMTLATADGDGRPWATPVWFSERGLEAFVWVSRSDTRHSENIAVRPAVGIAVYDSTVAVGQAAAVYIEAEASVVPDEERTELLDVFNERGRAQQLREWEEDDVTGSASFRLYRALVSRLYVLDAEVDRRILVPRT